MILHQHILWVCSHTRARTHTNQVTQTHTVPVVPSKSSRRSAPAAEPLGSASSPPSTADSDLLPVEHLHENLLDVDGSNYGF